MHALSRIYPRRQIPRRKGVSNVDAKTYPEFSIRYPLLLTTLMNRPVSLKPDETGIVYRNPDTDQYFRFTWRQWYERTCRLANALKALGGLDVLVSQATEWLPWLLITTGI